MSAFDVSLLTSGPYHDMLVKGLSLSLNLLGITLVLSLPLGLLVALLRLSPLAPLRALAWTYVEGIRNVPLLAHMLFWYFGAPELLPESTREWLYGQNFEAIAAVFALTLYTAAYMSEDMRSGSPFAVDGFVMGTSCGGSSVGIEVPEALAQRSSKPADFKASESRSRPLSDPAWATRSSAGPVQPTTGCPWRVWKAPSTSSYRPISAGRSSGAW